MGTIVILNSFSLICSFINILFFLTPVQNDYNFPIAGNRTIAECISGIRPEHWNAEKYITTTELARQLGYLTEDHIVLTEDGYILTLHRIKRADGGPPVFLQHGLFSSSYHFVVTGKNQSSALILADNGYDVWLGNCRGSTYSLCHTKYTTSENEFWNFSWHEQGVIDLAAQVTYVTNVTKQGVIIVGISMGATISYVMAIERPDVAPKVKAIINLGSIAYLEYITSPLKYFAPFVRIIEVVAKIVGGELKPPPKKAIEYTCSLTLTQKKICASIMFWIYAGFDHEQFNYTLLPASLYHVTSASWKTSIHYFQVMNSNRFQYYDYGRNENLRKYGSIKPPLYNISKINVPVGIFWSPNDKIASPKDVHNFYEQLPNKILLYEVEDHKFNHLDFVLGIDAPKYVYPKLMSVMDNYK